MSSEWDDTPWSGTAIAPVVSVVTRVPDTAAQVVKAASGIGLSYFETDTPMSSLRRSPQKVMREAQAAYHKNPWVRAAENAVTRKVANVPWHLEDDNDDEIDDKSPANLKLVRDLIEKPQAMAQNVGRKMTRRSLWSITSRHVGLCGMAYWYLDALDTARTPTSILYVNPARVWAASDDAGNLLGWVLDAKDEQGHGGTPLQIDELIPFYLDEPDFGHYGSGLYEAALLKAQVTTLADRHAAYLLGTGGRIPGIVSLPVSIGPDEFKELVQAFRNINDAPDAAKRTNIVNGPIDFTETGSDPSELSLLDLSRMNRDDIFTIWGVPQSQAPIAGPVGMNSGDTRKYDEATLWQGPVHDRLISIGETIQYHLLDRFQAAGITVELEIEEPEFDDDTPKYEIAFKAKEQPLTNNERRAILGLDPLPEYGPDGEPLGLAIVLPGMYVVMAQGPQETGEFSNALPPEEPPPAPPPVTVLPPNQPLLGDGKATPERVREKLRARFEPAIRKVVAALLAEQRAEIVKRVKTGYQHLSRKPTDTSVWWNERKWNDKLTAALRGQATGLATTVVAQLGEAIKPAKAEFEDRVAEQVLRSVGKRIGGINETTREAIAGIIEDAVQNGATANELADAIEEATTFDEYRAELIARTETGYVYNDAAVASYREGGIERVEVIDGDGDEICAPVNGAVWTLDEANSNPLGHPNCTRDFVPLFGTEGKSESAVLVPVEDEPRVVVHLPKPPSINVAAPNVVMDATPFAAALNDLRTLLTTPRKRTIVRDANGRIIGMEEA